MPGFLFGASLRSVVIPGRREAASYDVQLHIIESITTLSVGYPGIEIGLFRGSF